MSSVYGLAARENGGHTVGRVSGTTSTRSLYLQWADEQFEKHVASYRDQIGEDAKLDYVLSWNRLRSPLELQSRLQTWLDDRYAFYVHYFSGAKHVADQVQRVLVRVRDGFSGRGEARLAIYHILEMNRARCLALDRERARLCDAATFLVHSLVQQSVPPYSEDDVADVLRNACDTWSSVLRQEDEHNGDGSRLSRKDDRKDSIRDGDDDENGGDIDSAPAAAVIEVQVAAALQLVSGGDDYEDVLDGFFKSVSATGSRSWFELTEAVDGVEGAWEEALGVKHGCCDALLRVWLRWARDVREAVEWTKKMSERCRGKIGGVDEAEAKEEAAEPELAWAIEEEEADLGLPDGRPDTLQSDPLSPFQVAHEAFGAAEDVEALFSNGSDWTVPQHSGNEIDAWREEYTELMAHTRTRAMPPIPEGDDEVQKGTVAVESGSDSVQGASIGATQQPSDKYLTQSTGMIDLADEKRSSRGSEHVAADREQLAMGPCLLSPPHSALQQHDQTLSESESDPVSDEEYFTAEDDGMFSF